MVGGDLHSRAISMPLAMDGRLVQIAFLQGSEVTLNMMQVMTRRLTVTGSTLRPQSQEAKAAIARDLEAEVWPHLDVGTIGPVMDSVFPLAEAAAALCADGKRGEHRQDRPEGARMSFDWRAHDLSELAPPAPLSGTPRPEPGTARARRGVPGAFRALAQPSRGAFFDIPHPELNWLQVAADAGFAAYALDIRGYGLSRPRQLPPTALYATGDEAVADIADAVDWISTRHVRRPGRAGRLVLGLDHDAPLNVAGPGRGRVSALVQYAPIHAEVNEGWRDLLADPRRSRPPARSRGAVRLGRQCPTPARAGTRSFRRCGVAERGGARGDRRQASIADDGDPAGTYLPGAERHLRRLLGMLSTVRVDPGPRRGHLAPRFLVRWHGRSDLDAQRRAVCLFERLWHRSQAVSRDRGW